MYTLKDTLQNCNKTSTVDILVFKNCINRLKIFALLHFLGPLNNVQQCNATKCCVFA